jgi:hypothetical protein
MEIKNMKLMILTLATAMFAMRLPAPPIAPMLSISQVVSNSVTITVIGGNPYNYALQMSTNLTAPNWVSLQTNYAVIPPIVFTNIPATNATEYFRMRNPP